MHKPLPDNPYPLGSPQFHAYERCLELERPAENDSGLKFSPQMCGRILGYMMLEAPTSEGRDNVRREIETCDTDKELRDVAGLYATYFLRLFKMAKGPIPVGSSHPSRPSFDDTRDSSMYLMEQAQKSNSAVKKLALKRDNYRCLVTGAYDGATYQKQLEADDTFIPPSTPRFTQAAHIFPYSLNQDLTWPGELQGKKVSFSLVYGTSAASLMFLVQAEYSATAWTVVHRFGQVNVSTESLNGPDIHRVENVLTMCESAHKLFDQLQLWFEATDVPNTYNICTNNKGNFALVDSPVPRQVTFESTNTSISLPNSHYLRIHAACAKVARLSGAAEYLETILNEWEERPVLASDGGSADMLSFLLARASSFAVITAPLRPNSLADLVSPLRPSRNCSQIFEKLAAREIPVSRMALFKDY
ncbi:hypothetical protein FRC00_004177 [Tulasnella sp. 408]|nr:hypothetical protein FRC00_004177 [Tulasnella sp. 408]